MVFKNELLYFEAMIGSFLKCRLNIIDFFKKYIFLPHHRFIKYALNMKLKAFFHNTFNIMY
jgi:hypothetical protein